MIERVVDTNVAIVANGRNTNASIECRAKALEFLRVMIRSGRVVLDADGAMLEEYRRYLSPSGQPGVGDRFYQTILNSGPESVLRIDLPKDPVSGEYLDFPKDTSLSTFDPDDRVFAAAARQRGVPVANAVDSGWLKFRAALESNGISVEFVCSTDRSTWFVDS